jgi:hypothetical protein
MRERVTIKDVEAVFKLYTDFIEELYSLPHGKGKPSLVEGSKTNGRAYRLYYENAGGGQSYYPGTSGNGYLGMTKKEAYETLWIMYVTAVEVKDLTASGSL